MSDDYGWARVYSGRVLHYYGGYPYNPATAICGFKGSVRMHWADHLDDTFHMGDQYWRYPKCKKCLAKLEGK